MLQSKQKPRPTNTNDCPHLSLKYLRKALPWPLEALSDPYWLHICYFVGISIVGFLLLWISPTKTRRHLSNVDVFYTSVSALTVTSLGAVRMQEFSEFQLLVLIILMFIGGEVFTSMLCLHLRRLTYHHTVASKPKKVESQNTEMLRTFGLKTNKPDVGHSANMIENTNATARCPMPRSASESDLQNWLTGRRIKMEVHRMETETENISSGNVEYSQSKDGLSVVDMEITKTNPECIMQEYDDPHENLEKLDQNKVISSEENNVEDMEYQALTYLGYIALAYLVVVQLLGVILMTIYFSVSSNSEHILKTRGINTSTFAVFTTVSSFANCGFTPLDDNMMAFRKNSVLLFIVAFQILLGNTMFAPCLRAIIWFLHRFSRDKAKQGTYEYILEHNTTLYQHLFPSTHSVWLMLTVVGFLILQIILLCALHWGTEALDGLNTYEKLVGAFFQSVAIRHAGENVVNPELLCPAIIVLYIVMMYLPPYPVHLPDRNVKNIKPPPKTRRAESKLSAQRKLDTDHFMSLGYTIAVQLEKLLFHDSCYLIIVIIIICITERNSFSTDPLNYKVLNVVFDVVSAYGNVGMSVGYSCELLRKVSGEHCEDVAYSFSGKWSNKGKLLIIFVMFLGRLKGIERRPGTLPIAKIQFALIMKKVFPSSWFAKHCHHFQQHHNKREIQRGVVVEAWNIDI